MTHSQLFSTQKSPEFAFLESNFCTSSQEKSYYENSQRYFRVGRVLPGQVTQSLIFQIRTLRHIHWTSEICPRSHSQSWHTWYLYLGLQFSAPLLYYTWYIFGNLLCVRHYGGYDRHARNVTCFERESQLFEERQLPFAKQLETVKCHLTIP